MHTPTYQNKPGGDTLNDTGNGISDTLLQKLQVRDFYSLFPLTVCEGNFSEDGTRTLTKCHPYFSGTPTHAPAYLAPSRS
jgi:hypothetical protein